MENQISIKALQLNAVDDIISQHRKTASVLRREGYSYPSISQKVVHFKTAYLSSLGPVPIQINTKQIRNIYSASTVAKNVENHEALRQKCLSCDDGYFPINSSECRLCSSPFGMWTNRNGETTNYTGKFTVLGERLMVKEIGFDAGLPESVLTVSMRAGYQNASKVGKKVQKLQYSGVTAGNALDALIEMGHEEGQDALRATIANSSRGRKAAVWRDCFVYFAYRPYDGYISVRCADIALINDPLYAGVVKYTSLKHLDFEVKSESMIN